MHPHRVEKSHPCSERDNVGVVFPIPALLVHPHFLFACHTGNPSPLRSSVIKCVCVWGGLSVQGLKVEVDSMHRLSVNMLKMELSSAPLWIVCWQNVSMKHQSLAAALFPL